MNIVDVTAFTDDFKNIDAAFTKEKGSSVGFVRTGRARSQLFRQSGLVDFTVSWMGANRK